VAGAALLHLDLGHHLHLLFVVRCVVVDMTSTTALSITRSQGLKVIRLIVSPSLPLLAPFVLDLIFYKSQYVREPVCCDGICTDWQSHCRDRSFVSLSRCEDEVTVVIDEQQCAALVAIDSATVSCVDPHVWSSFTFNNQQQPQQPQQQHTGQHAGSVLPAALLYHTTKSLACSGIPVLCVGSSDSLALLVPQQHELLASSLLTEVAQTLAAPPIDACCSM
jgi:hypothetical protein